MASSDYTSHLSFEAVAFVVSLSKRRQRAVLDIADHSNQIGDYQTKDAVGRGIDNLRVGKHVSAYWVDHAVKEVRITDIVSL
jgi:hypothetical protein